MQSNYEKEQRMATTSFVVRGHKVRTQSHFRYQLVSVRDAGARIVGRTDSIASARERTNAMRANGHDIVIVDRTTGEAIDLIHRVAQEPVIVKQEVTQEQPGRVDPAALFLVDLTYPNMFELRGSTDGRRLDSYCKVCGEIVERANQETHHAGHKRDRANHVAAGFAARKESSDMAKANTVTPKDQGIPAVYLNADGTKFVPGKDASLKRDLIAAIDSLDNPNALHTFTEQEAAKILAARDWNAWLLKSRKGREAKEARQAAKAEAKKNKVKDEVAAKRVAKAQTAKTEAEVETTDEVKPDPKPAPKVRNRRSRKVGA